MRNNHKNILTSVLLAFAVTASAVAQDLRAPLDPSDPRAQTDAAAYADYLPLPNPEYGPQSYNALVKLVAHDVETGITAEGKYVPAFKANKGRAQLSTPFKGIATGLDTEPKGMDFNIQYVIGSDQRSKITTTASYPWSTQCKLYIRFSDGSNWIGSGTLIQSRYVLTAGHCIHDKNRGGWATRVEVVPGMNGSYRPFGNALASRFASSTGWTNDKDRDHDFGVIKLDRTIGNSTGWLGYGSFSDSTLNNTTLHIAGYDGDRDGGNSQLYRYGARDSISSKRIEYTMDTSGGSSGASIYLIQNGNRYAAGVNAYERWWWFFGTHYMNGGTRLDSQKFSWIQGWLNGGL